MTGEELTKALEETNVFSDIWNKFVQALDARELTLGLEKASRSYMGSLTGQYKWILGGESVWSYYDFLATVNAVVTFLFKLRRLIFFRKN